MLSLLTIHLFQLIIWFTCLNLILQTAAPQKGNNHQWLKHILCVKLMFLYFERRKEINVRESPTGQIIVNGKVIHVFDEQCVEKIPWELAGI